MNKVFDLYRYLKLSGFGRELEILKTALETTPEELEEAFPQLFRFYEEGRPTAMFGGVFAQINKYIEEGYITQQEIDEIQTFDLLKQKMKELKTLKKETEAKFKYLNEYNIEQVFKDLAKQKKLSKEDFEFAYKSFIAEDEDNHQLDQAISEIADLREKYILLKQKINTIEDNEELLSRLADPLSYKTLNGAYTEINNLMMNVNNIIEGRQSDGLKKKLLNYYDYIYNGENKLNADYLKKRKGIAKKTSKVLYNDGDWAIVNSSSPWACQYWERGAVRVEGNKVRFNTCTSRINGVHGLTNENMYSSYSKYKIIQILKLENGQPKFYEGPNEMLTLCFELEDDNYEMVEGSSASVNADDKNMTKEMVAKALPENIYSELQDILNSYKKYQLLNFKQLLDLDIPDEIRLKVMYNGAKHLNEYSFFVYEHLIPEEVFAHFAGEKAKGLGARELFYYKNSIPEEVFNSLAAEKAKDLNKEDFFENSDKIPEEVFNSLAEEKAKELSANAFFVFRNKIPEKVFNSLAEEKAEELGANLFFASHKEAIPKEVFKSLVADKLVNIDVTKFLKYYRNNLLDELIEKAVEMPGNEFLDYYRNNSPE